MVQLCRVVLTRVVYFISQNTEAGINAIITLRLVLEVHNEFPAKHKMKTTNTIDSDD